MTTAEKFLLARLLSRIADLRIALAPRLPAMEEPEREFIACSLDRLCAAGHDLYLEARNADAAREAFVPASQGVAAVGHVDAMASADTLAVLTERQALDAEFQKARLQCKALVEAWRAKQVDSHVNAISGQDTRGVRP
jgi:hypothetical protein